jgi:O-acetyl-ADP-ribose deacetylase (regulator of RNase III)
MPALRMDRLILTAVEPGLADAWRRSCGEFPFVEVVEESILNLEVDAVVSPANSFGFMDGGIDALYLRRFGPELQDAVRRAIVEQRRGELLVGDALIVATGDGRIPYLISAPTMRVPMQLSESVNPYLAARAVFLLVEDGRFSDGRLADEPIGDHVHVVALPGLGTGVGRVSPAVCAHQVRQAIVDVLLEQYRVPSSWAEASERHQLLYTDGPRRLQH